jgi:hypothetical protein
MPIKQCQSDGKPGFQWGESGKCYTYTPGDKASRERARQKALKQGRAVEASERRREDG